MKQYLKNALRPMYQKLSDSISLPLNKELELIKQDVKRVEAENIDLKNNFSFIFENKYGEWLYRNRGERMDATLPFFKELRREFHLARYEFASKHINNKIVADIACGTGYGTNLYSSEKNPKKIFGIDISKEAIEYAKEIHKKENIEYICASANNTGLKDNSIDVLSSFETLEHLKDEEGLLNEFYRILKNDGLLIISTPNSWPLSIAEHHEKEYDLKEFTRVLSKKFEIVNLYNQNSGTPWKYNRNQLKGIIKTTKVNEALAECYIAVCKK